MSLLLVGLVGSVFAVSGGVQTSPVHVEASARPATVGVGDPVRYVVEARLPGAGLDMSNVRVFADTGPLTRIGPTKTTHTTDGSTVVVALEQEVACLDLGCAPGDGARRTVLPVPRVTVRTTGGGVLTGRGEPVVVAVAPRVARTEVRAVTPAYRRETALPPPGGGAGRLVPPLAVVASAFAAVAAALALSALRRSKSRPTEPELTRAIRLLRESAARPAPDRRRAAGMLSRLAGAEGARSIAADAGRLAWSAPPPEPESAVALAERAEGVSP